ncbi:MAG: TlpA disulfide reductase family protein [Gammaproteobacteria bacterium]|jgi:peroxiredoxin|nr:TlpA disulfide reductase family protein [Gammaproteobacteria bacterium]
MHRRYFYLLAALALAGAGSVSASPARLLEAPAPDFALRSLSGSNLRLSEYRSEVVIVNFWSRWCGKCAAAMSTLESLQQQYADAGVRILGVAVEGKAEKAAATMAELGLSYPQLLDSTQQVSRDYDLSRLPATLVIDREGTVRFVYQGSDAADAAALAANVNALLAE